MSGKRIEYQPLYYAIFAIIGLWLGKYLYQDSLLPNFNFSQGHRGKIEDVLQTIDQYYVDSVNSSELTEESIRKLLDQLDPHSYYLTAEQIKYEEEQMQGNFSGIGIEFRIIQDTLTVLHPIKDGPSEKAGIQAGDKIIEVDGKAFTGPAINSDKAMSTLRGPIGSEVELLLLQNGESSRQIITRGEIPLPSVDHSQFIQPGVGYIKVTRFGAQTTQEFKTALEGLSTENKLERLIIDLRDNPGGLMHSVVQISELFLRKGQQIVYTKGRTEEEDYTASEDGPFADLPLTVLINENSASASEILAGCMQDNDRATVIGRRSFGKGLVQRSFYLNDGSSFRLTIARYYTPVGRCIQKDYSHGKEEYEEEAQNRINNGELLYKDSIQLPDSLKFKTPGGKVVYGGGGIVPDIFVPIDTNLNVSAVTSENLELLNEYLVKHFYFWRAKLNGLNLSEANQYLDQHLALHLQQFLADQQGAENLKPLIPLGEQRIKSKLLQDLHGKKGLYYNLLEEDLMIQKALQN